jgi:hypothetical protein
MKQFLEQKEIQYMEADELLRIDVEGERSNWQVFFRPVDEEKLLVIYSLFHYKAPAEKLKEVALLLSEINYGLKIGNFEINLENGEIHFKTYLDIVDDNLPQLWIERSISINVTTMEHFAPRIVKAVID